MSIHKPFEIGDRVELEDGTIGIIKDINMRHVVLIAQDSMHTVIPNSKINDMTLRNYSYHSRFRSILFYFHAAYGTYPELVIRTIKEAVDSSLYSRSGNEMGDGQVYFMGYEESSLKFAVTVFFEPTEKSESVITDINIRVKRAFEKNGIEIPYKYINIINKTDDSARESRASGSDSDGK